MNLKFLVFFLNYIYIYIAEEKQMKVNEKLSCFFFAGHLSQRMLLPDNAWTTTWNSAQPVPAHRQKRLFDDTREAEKALLYLSSKRIGQIAQLLLPVLTHAALITLSEQKVEARPNIQNVVQNIQNKLQLASKPVHQKMHFYEVMIFS